MQAVLLGPSLLGEKVLLPLDTLTMPGFCIPPSAGEPTLPVHNWVLSDRVLSFEPRNQFVASELRAGRLPLWSPMRFAGAPFVWPTYSPFTLLHALFPAPVTYAWLEVARAVIAGVGAYVFFRSVLKLSHWPATVGAWCYPLTSYFILWQGYLLASNALWFPWLLISVDKTIRSHGRGRAAPGLALITGLTILSGQPDVAAQVLLACGLYALFCLYDHYVKGATIIHVCRQAFILSAAWIVGIMLSTIYLLPLVDYLGTGARMQNRAAGTEERPPKGLEALPQFVLPDVYGRSQIGWHRPAAGNRLESSASGYVGLIATLLVAPLAFCSREHRSRNFFMLGLAVISFGWQLNIPGLVHLMRLPGLNMLSHNRFVFAGAFAILTLATVGLDSMWHRLPRVNGWSLLPRIAVMFLCAFSFYRMNRLPDSVLHELPKRIQKGEIVGNVRTMADVATVHQTLRMSALAGGIICFMAVIGWQVLRSAVEEQQQPEEEKQALGPSSAAEGHWLGPVCSLAMILELLWYARGVNPVNAGQKA